MDSLLALLKQDYPSLRFTEGTTFSWSPMTGQILYNTKARNKKSATYSVLHEVAHALLDHEDYRFDYELLQLELAAWEHSKLIAKDYSITIDEDYIQKCLDSYRDWLYRRSICPLCGNKSLQSAKLSYYQCFNCRSRWQVASSKFCRPYRQHKDNKKSPATVVVGDSFESSVA